MKAAGAILLAIAAATGARADPPRPAAEIAALIEAAEPGATVLIPPGTYHGALRIARPVVLDGADAVTLDGLGATVVLEIAAAPVTVRRMTVRGSGDRVDHEPAAVRAEVGPVVIEHLRVEDALFGIDLKDAAGSVVRHNTVTGRTIEPERRGDGIRLWWSPGSVVEHNLVTDSRDMVFWYCEGLTVRGNTVRDSRYGLHFMYSHGTTVSGNTLTGNSVGIYLMYSNTISVERNSITNNRGPSGYGVGLKDCDDIRVVENALLANRVGIYVDNSPSSIGSTGLVASNTIAFNESGVIATPNTHDNEFTGNAFIENEEQVGVHGRGTLHLNRFAKDGTGNFWSDYAGFDADADGAGDLAYEPRSLFESLLAREPNLRFFQHSPAQQAVEFTARALPELRPEPKLVDPAPLTRVPPTGLGAPVPPRTSGAAMGAFAAGLLAAAGGTVWALARDPGARRMAS